MHVGIAKLRWREKRYRHSRRMRNMQFYVSGKRVDVHYSNKWWTSCPTHIIVIGNREVWPVLYCGRQSFRFQWLMYGILFMYSSTSQKCFCHRIFFLNNGLQLPSCTSLISDLRFKLGIIKSLPGFVADSTRGVLSRGCTCPLFGSARLSAWF